MNEPSFHFAPLDDQATYPVTMHRVSSALEELRYEPKPGLPEPETALRLEIDGNLFVFSVDPARRYLSVRSMWDTHADYVATSNLFFLAADTWNRERYFPTVYTIASSAGHSQVVADYLTASRHGLSNHQLIEALRIGIATGTDAMRFMRKSAESVLHTFTKTITNYDPD